MCWRRFRATCFGFANFTVKLSSFTEILDSELVQVFSFFFFLLFSFFRERV